MNKAKPFCIAKREVWEACKQVKANRGVAGVDGQSIENFERDLSNNLYRIWNRMSSGSYVPPPVRRVDIPTCAEALKNCAGSEGGSDVETIGQECISARNSANWRSPLQGRSRSRRTG